MQKYCFISKCVVLCCVVYFDQLSAENWSNYFFSAVFNLFCLFLTFFSIVNLSCYLWNTGLIGIDEKSNPPKKHSIGWFFHSIWPSFLRLNFFQKSSHLASIFLPFILAPFAGGMKFASQISPLLNYNI